MMMTGTGEGQEFRQALNASTSGTDQTLTANWISR